MGVSHENFLGATSTRAVEEEVLKKVDTYVSMLQYSAEECEGERVKLLYTLSLEVYLFPFIFYINNVRKY